MKKLKKILLNNIIGLIFLGVIFIICSFSYISIFKESYKKLTSEESTKKVKTDTTVVTNIEGNIINQSLIEGIRRCNSKLKTTVNRIDTKLCESIFMKDFFAHIDTNLNFFISGTVNSNQVLHGKNNWLFYKTKTDGDPIADFQGTNLLTEDQINILCNNMLQQFDYLNNNGIRLIILLPPNKEQVYNIYMPDKIKRVNFESKTDKIVAALRNKTNITTIYPKQELIDMSQDYQVYYKFDTHWNQLGAYIAEQQILFALYNKRDYLPDQIITYHQDKAHEIPNDLANMLGMKWYFQDDVEPYIRIPQEHHNVIDSIYNNKNAVYKESVLFIGDSFRTAMIQHLTHDFENIEIIHRNNYNKEKINSFKPDIVILEYVERYSDSLIEFNILN